MPRIARTRKRPDPFRWLFQDPNTGIPFSLRFFIGFLPAFLVWSVRCASLGSPWIRLMEGALTLGAWSLFASRVHPKGYYTLWIPGVWMACSSWALTIWAPGASSWAALALFFAVSALTLPLKDPRGGLAVWILLWTAAAWNGGPGFLFPLGYAILPLAKHKGMAWLRGGAGLAAVALGALYAARGGSFLPSWSAPITWVEFLFLPGGALAPFLLAWLGASHARTSHPLGGWLLQELVAVAFWGWNSPVLISWIGPESLGILALGGAFFGMEVLRRDLLDRSSHAAFLWGLLCIALGAAFA